VIDILKGIAAGAIATAVLSALMLAHSSSGLLPALDPLELLMSAFGIGDQRPLGWIVHFVIGALLWGALFAWVEPRLPGDAHARRGTLFGVLVWLVMMLVIMPLAGAGVFALRIGVPASLVTLLLHVVYGFVLGWTYGKLAPTRDPFASRNHRSTA
jgi:Protein of unknown function (DUF2938).